MARNPKPGQPADWNMILRLNKPLKARIERVVDRLNTMYPEGNFTSHSLAKAAIIKRVEELEREIGIKDSDN